MKSRPFIAWAIFLVALGLPTAALVTAGFYGARANVDRTRTEIFRERVDAATKMRQEIELAGLRGSEVLRAIPPDATVESALAAIASASNAFEVGFVAHEGLVEVPVAEDGRSPASDEPTRLRVRATLMGDHLVQTMVRSPNLTIRGMDVRYILTPSLVLATRDLRKGVRVGWLLDATTIARGAATVLSNQQALEAVPPREVDPHEPKVNEDIFLRPPGLGDSERSIFLSAQPGKVAPAASLEDATLVVVGKNLAFRVVTKDPAALARGLWRQQLWFLFVFFSCLIIMDVLAVAMFWRARRAQHLADLRTDFVAAVSHELRTPLASVRMFAELLEAGSVAEDEREEVQQALAGETRRLHATLDRMLRFGALARGKLVIAKSRQPLAPVLEEASRKRTVKLEVDPDLEANIDGELLGLAVDNLLSNAAKYAPADEDGPHLVRARREGDDVVIDVVDHGPGLSKKALKKVFLPFERADQRLSRATEGSGVGLALVRGIARAHGGEASVASVLGSGATFTLRLPCN